MIFVDCILKLSEHGFPLTSFDLRIVIKSYLEKIGRKVSSLKMAGMAFQFYEEKIRLTQRFKNIKRSRAAIDRDTLTE